jgi:hypothetical protein
MLSKGEREFGGTVILPHSRTFDWGSMCLVNGQCVHESQRTALQTHLRQRFHGWKWVIGRYDIRSRGIFMTFFHSSVLYFPTYSLIAEFMLVAFIHSCEDLCHGFLRLKLFILLFSRFYWSSTAKPLRFNENLLCMYAHEHTSNKSNPTLKVNSITKIPFPRLLSTF